ncbi:MAG: methyltransferase domain-containing protein [Fimbriimonadaceae bacterium]|nr:methyltransferase domain-containing protein [Fimbriimonadaceae bacterium]
MIPKRRFLDPRLSRHAIEKPMKDAVSIPLDEIEKRPYELPDKSTPILVAGPEGYAAAAVEMLWSLGRAAEGVDESNCSYFDEPTTEANAGDEDRRPGRLWEPNDFLAERLKVLQPGRALDLGCGSGRDALYLASLDWEVTAIDRFASALEIGRMLGERYGVNGKIDWVEADIRNFQTEKQFDLITSFFIFEAGQIRRTLSWLAPGGSVLIETFSPEHRQRFKKPKDQSKVLSVEIAKKTLGAMSMPYVDTGNFFGERWTTRVHAVWELE